MILEGFFAFFARTSKRSFTKLPASASACADGRGFEPAHGLSKRKTRSIARKTSSSGECEVRRCRAPHVQIRWKSC